MKQLVVNILFALISFAAWGQQLNRGQQLLPGQSLSSGNGKYRLTYQTDGNLVLYRTRDNFALWSTKTDGKPAGKCAMQDDGNFVMYKPNGEFIWASVKNWDIPNPCTGKYLVMQDDGNAVIYDDNDNAVWSSGTYLEAVNENCLGQPCTNGPASVGQQLRRGQSLFPGQCLTSANRQYRLAYQFDGNLALYRNRDHYVLWATSTFNQGAGRCAMQDDGNFVVYKPDGKAVWASIKRWDVPNPCKGQTLIMQDDGNVVIYDENDAVVWHTGTYSDRVNNDPQGLPCSNSNTNQLNTEVSRKNERKSPQYSPESREEQDDIYCIKRKVSLTESSDPDLGRLVTTGVYQKLYPGAIYTAGSVQGGDFQEPTLDRVPYTIRVNGLTSAASGALSAVVQKPEDIESVMSKIIKDNARAINPSLNAILFTQIYSEEQLKLYLQGDYSGFGVQAGFTFDYLNKKKRNFYLGRIYQRYYSFDVLSNSDLVSPKATNDNAVYISSVSYGKIGYIYSDEIGFGKRA